jgi:hypothetical protein
LPGLSTAKKVTNLSGRGVGLDVVKRTIDELRGSINLSSTPGAGTTTRLTLPLTLAIVDGLLVEIDRDRFIIPMASVLENVELTAADRRAKNGRNLVNVRGELVPYVRLRELFEAHGEELDIEKVVIVAFNGQRLGLVVDHVLVRMRPELRKAVRFERLNFMDVDYGRRELFDVIFFRNVMIYFDRATQEAVVNRLTRQLAPGGYLFIGHSESSVGMRVPLGVVAPSVPRRGE